MLLRIHPENPNKREIKQVIECLKDGGIIVYPSDTVYGIGCDIFNKKSVERIAKIKGRNLKKNNFSFICSNLSHISHYTKQIDNTVYKLMKRNLPGPFTFILNANNSIPKLFKTNKKTVGIRIPNHNIPLDIVSQLGNPILTTSVKDDDKLLEHSTDPELIHEKLEHLVNIVIDGGYTGNIPSTVVDCTKSEFEILRQGKGDLIL
ncbi:MAG: threonylcarbamoyl-AMP synthase [Flavobacteriales bacterium]|jgi:tRNA threonylcarbamoyl adenosine modification protein (Sua5/YciO/YrdC/YwlC family)|nr:threonylcarbamoyl-AMP synthase [Flavobacteriales bacterium]MBT4478613.1 threonylcarbamoyl-AMP synthase [Flavobacteriales bacterium]MBT5699241.1 threonylcarbamoyl-AMP synthase [Flavobacteriales bacterium]MBT7620207.1 threonylcarbamoyl-AMP synthase [Flavobacteriales bacterium]MBT7727227.1 threonylcarbamoyl-AMP synthase [Flavobacteriales bacterium]